MILLAYSSDTTGKGITGTRATLGLLSTFLGSTSSLLINYTRDTLGKRRAGMLWAKPLHVSRDTPSVHQCYSRLTRYTHQGYSDYTPSTPRILRVKARHTREARGTY